MVVGALVVAGLFAFIWPGTPLSVPPLGLPIGGAAGSAPGPPLAAGLTATATATATAAAPAIVLPGGFDDPNAPGGLRRSRSPNAPSALPGTGVTPGASGPVPDGQPPPDGPPPEGFLPAAVRRLTADAGSAAASTGDAAGRTLGGSAGETVRRTGQSAGDGVRRTGAAAADAAGGSARRVLETRIELPVPADLLR